MVIRKITKKGRNDEYSHVKIWDIHVSVLKEVVYPYLIVFEVPTTNALLAIIDALYTAAFARNAETSFLAIRNSSKRFSTLDATSSAFTFKKQYEQHHKLLLILATLKQLFCY